MLMCVQFYLVYCDLSILLFSSVECCLYIFYISRVMFFFFFFSSRRRHTRWTGDWSSDVCSSDLDPKVTAVLRDCSCVSAPHSSVAPVGRAGPRAQPVRMARPATRPTEAMVEPVDSAARHRRCLDRKSVV